MATMFLGLPNGLWVDGGGHRALSVVDDGSRRGMEGEGGSGRGRIRTFIRGIRPSRTYGNLGRTSVTHCCTLYLDIKISGFLTTKNSHKGKKILILESHIFGDVILAGLRCSKFKNQRFGPKCFLAAEDFVWITVR